MAGGMARLDNRRTAVREKQHSITPKNSAQEPLDVSSAGDLSRSSMVAAKAVGGDST
jgi:hypothetical protein